MTDELLDRQLEQAAASRGSRTAIVDGAHRLTYADLFRRVESLAHAMRERGIGPGDVVSFQLPNWWEASVVHFATIRLGAVSNPLVPILRHRELEFMLRQADSKMLFVPSRHRGFDYAALASRLCHELPSLEAMVVVRGAHGRALTFDGLLEAGAPFAEPAGATGRSADDPALLMYTSGTESRPKGVVHSHNGLVYENRTMIVRYALSDRDAVFMPSPVTHISGLLYGIHLPVALRTKVALLDQWRPERGRDLVSAENCTFTVGATPFLNGLVDAEPEDGSGSSLRYFVCGGADVPPHLVRLADEKLKCVVVRAYGSTEFPTLSAGSPGDSVERRANTDGQIIGAAEARVMTDDGTVAPPGVAGDLYVRGPEAFLGYLDAKDTEAAIGPDGWISTGDQAVVDTEGYVRITGRTKDIILRGGENISAKEVEEILGEHPAIREVAVVAMPDEVLTEKACAFVVPRPGAALGLGDVVRYLESTGTARQKFPERLELVESLPKTASGKVQKVILRQMVKERLAAEQAASRTGS
ncbi:cyclohexanecarboxylate-CoA ligase [Amycolatopsis endophytica]|uniref:Cyclohexanecarboxylate-CoA ligase n=1 Tax=Amycolatopsis endophytica TaxID=860233 RepID=A0A853BFX2_9PSEU|nr:AMP-binding protein [Amycolatopsis endophytica]NYI93645.1 cyclohexanecarboxylate-CoA ligase [Amycolatopsis endophytica]